jgi:flagellar motor switch protein FliM
MHPQFVGIVAPDDLVVVSTFAIDFGGQGGALHICMPCSTLEPIRSLVERAPHADPAAPDAQWLQRMHAQLQGADVEVVADLASTTMTLGALMGIKAGDVLPIELSPRIAARIDGIPVMECGYGELNGRYALRVERVLRPQAERLGEMHG